MHSYKFFTFLRHVVLCDPYRDARNDGHPEANADQDIQTCSCVIIYYNM